MMRVSSLGCAALLGVLALGCGPEGGIKNTTRIDLVVTTVNGGPLPTADAPLPPNLGDIEEFWDFEASVLNGDGTLDTSFNGWARVDVVPGSVNRVEGPTADGRNILFEAGQAQGTAVVSAVFGPSRLWIEDMGYEPAPPGVPPTCSNGQDDDGDVAIDYPTDPGCAFADDMSEETGTLAVGVSGELSYERPTVAEVQGRGSQTPYPSVAVEIKTSAPNTVVVTRVSSDGFYVTDLGESQHNHLFAFNFNTPPGMIVCDQVRFLSGTAVEFFGFTEISFPSYEVEPLLDTQDCPLPDPPVLATTTIQSDVEMERLESGLVRLGCPPPIENCQVNTTGWRIASKFGSGLAINNNFTSEASNCDLNGDGTIDFFNDAENSCANACSADPDCTEWVGFASRGNYKVSKQGVMIQINTGTVSTFNPLLHKGQVITQLTGTLRNFSGGSLNWTVETRCGDDLVCDFDDESCSPQTVPIQEACVTLRTETDNDSGTN